VAKEYEGIDKTEPGGFSLVGNFLMQQITDRIVQQRKDFADFRDLIDKMTWSHKIAIAQIGLHKISFTATLKYVDILPLWETFDDQIKASVELMERLPVNTLKEIVIEILEEPRDHNEH